MSDDNVGPTWTGQTTPGKSEARPPSPISAVVVKVRSISSICRVFALLSIAPTLCACTQDLSCSGTDVQAALHRALDNLYAEARTLSKVDVSIKDIISVGQSDNRVSCKAVAHLEVTFLNVVQQADPIIPYTAEITDSGQILVTTTP